MTDYIAALGAVTVSVGVGVIYPPAGVIVAGILLLVLAVIFSLAEDVS